MGDSRLKHCNIIRGGKKEGRREKGRKRKKGGREAGRTKMKNQFTENYSVKSSCRTII